MARLKAILREKESTPVVEIFRGGVSTLTSVGTTAIEVPATPLSYRKSIAVQNIDSAKNVFVGMSVPEIVIGKPQMIDGTMKPVDWIKAAAGTYEWYAVSTSGGNPGLTQPVRLYYATIGGGAETLGTSGSAGTLSAQHKWAWAAEPAAAFSTIYIRTDGGTIAENPKLKYDLILTYPTVPDNSSSYGWMLRPYEGISFNLDGSAKVFAIASSASASVITLELR